MSFELSNIADGASLVILVVFGRLGYRNGFAESVWLMLMWLLTAVGGGLAWSPLGDLLRDLLGFPRLACSYLAYILASAGLAGVVLGLRRLYAAQLLLLVPLGRTDGFLGMGTGAVTGGAVALVALALLNPLGTGPDEVEWNPMDLHTDDAISSLVTAVVGSVHQVVVQESTVGRLVTECIPDILIADPSPYSTDEEPYDDGDQLSLVPGF